MSYNKRLWPEQAMKLGNELQNVTADILEKKGSELQRLPKYCLGSMARPPNLGGALNSKAVS